MQVRVLCRHRSRSCKFNLGVTVLITCHRYSRSVLKGEYDGGEKRLSLSLIGKSFLITFFCSLPQQVGDESDDMMLGTTRKCLGSSESSTTKYQWIHNQSTDFVSLSV